MFLNLSEQFPLLTQVFFLHPNAKNFVYVGDRHGKSIAVTGVALACPSLPPTAVFRKNEKNDSGLDMLHMCCMHSIFVLFAC